MFFIEELSLQKRLDQKGITLLEVMVGMIILGIGLLGLVPLIGISIFSNTYASDVTTANSLAQQELESLTNIADYGTLPLISTSDSVGGVYNIVRSVDDNSTDATVPVGLYKLKVALTWTDQQNNIRNVYFSTLKPKI